jgi:hypothetical protein
MSAPQFNAILAEAPKYNNFNLSQVHKTTHKMGYLIPTYWSECLPGDKWSFKQENFIRLAPMVAPPMQEIKAKTYVFSVPLRIIWENFGKFISPPKPDVEHIWPHVVTDAGFIIREDSLGRYLGLPWGPNAGNYTIGTELSVLPVAAYYMIFDEWMRNQNIQADPLSPAEVVDGDNTADWLQKFVDTPLYSNWEKDYFTSALPYAQKGDQVTIPLVTQGTDPLVGLSGTNATGFIRKASDGLIDATNAALTSDTSGGLVKNGNYSYYDPNGTLAVFLQADAANITTLRNAFKLQEFLEREAYSGTRYTEHLWAFWEVVSSDARQQRPEPLGMFSEYVRISEVLNTSSTTDEPLGDYAGHGIALSKSGNMRYYAEEHCLIMSLTVVKPDPSYDQGIERAWTRSDRFDYPFPQFQHIGEQAIENREVHFQHANPLQTFGYTPRYMEWKHKNNRYSGEMSSTRNFWHLGRTLSAGVQLNESFIQCIPSERIFAVTTEDTVIATYIHEAYVKRKLAFFGRPMM